MGGQAVWLLPGRNDCHKPRLLRSGHRRVGGLHGSAVPMPPAQGGTALGAIIAVWVFGI
jgi:hypothetical protein